MILQKILRFAEEDLARVELEIRQQLCSEVDRIGEIGRYLLLSGGKRIRPMLLLLTAKLAGYSGERIFPLSAMIEFMHTATLLHDDVIDHSHLRRGHPTVNSRWGSALSILVGDFLYAKAMALVVDDGDVTRLESADELLGSSADAHGPDENRGDRVDAVGHRVPAFDAAANSSCACARPLSLSGRPDSILASSAARPSSSSADTVAVVTPLSTIFRTCA